jgi:hypothetical protein
MQVERVSCIAEEPITIMLKKQSRKAHVKFIILIRTWHVYPILVKSKQPFLQNFKYILNLSK